MRFRDTKLLTAHSVGTLPGKSKPSRENRDERDPCVQLKFVPVDKMVGRSVRRIQNLKSTTRGDETAWETRTGSPSTERVIDNER